MTTPLSDERIAELTYRLKGPVTNPLDWWCEADDLFTIGRELLAEVDRLRARNAELEEQNGRLRAMVDNVVGQTAGTLMRAQDAERRIAERQGGHEWRRH